MSDIKSLESQLATLRAQTGGSINMGKVRHHKIRSLEKQLERLRIEEVEVPTELEEETKSSNV